MPTPQRVNPKLWRIYKKLRSVALSAEAEQPNDDDLGLESGEGARTHLVWGTYSAKGIEAALRAYGTTKRMEARGVGPLRLELDLKSPFRPHLTWHAKRYREPVVDVVLSKSHGRAMGLQTDATLLCLESLLLQHPGRVFTWRRPPLPGQRHPGLSMSTEVLELLLLMARRIGAQGLVLTPASFHAAVIYARHFRFIDASAQADFERLCALAVAYPLFAVAWGLELGCVRTPEGRTYSFSPAPMLAALTHEVAAERPREQARHKGRLVLDVAKLQKLMPWAGMPKGSPPAPLKKIIGPRPKA